MTRQGQRLENPFSLAPRDTSPKDAQEVLNCITSEDRCKG